MNIHRLVFYAVVLLVLRTLVSAVIEGFVMSDGTGVSVFVKYSIEYIFDGLTVILIFMKLARVQVRFLYTHVFSIIILQELFGVTLLYVLGVANPPSPLSLVDWIVLLVSALLGAEIGRRMRGPVEKA